MRRSPSDLPRLQLGALLAVAALALLWIRGSTQPEALWWARGRPHGLHGPLRVATDASYPPFATTTADGTLAGLEVDLAKRLAERLGVRIVLTNTDVGSGLDALVADRFDAIIAGLAPAPELSRDVAFSRPYFEAGPVALVRADDSRLRRPGDLRGRLVGVELGAEIATRAASAASGSPPRSVAELEDLLSALEAGEIDAAVVDRATALERTASHVHLRALDPPLASDPLVIAVARRSRDLLYAIDHALTAMEEDGTLAALERRWLMEPVAARPAPAVPVARAAAAP